MTNMYFELKNGYLMDVTRSVPKPLYYGTKEILKGGDSVQFNQVDKGIQVVRKKGEEVKVDFVVEKEGVYLLMPFFVKPVNKMSENHRKIYGLLRGILDENFFLEETEDIADPFEIHLKIDMDIAVKAKFIVRINTKILRADTGEIKRVIERAQNEIDTVVLYRTIGKSMMIKITDEIIDELNKLLNVHRNRMVV